MESPGAKVVSYFVATFVPDPVCHHLVALGSSLPDDVVKSPSTHMHVTYRSFDNMPHGLLVPFKEAMREVGSRHRPFRATLGGAGHFVKGAIWVAIQSDELLALQADIDGAIQALGLPPASHPFIPHVTLGHGPPGLEEPPIIHEYRDSFEVDRFLVTTTGRVEYRVMMSVGLGS